jgi:hypothetical protein
MPDSAVLRGILSEVRDKKILSPIIRSTLHSPSFTGFTLEVEGWTPRAYDGWIHPSTHTTWSVEQLVEYLTHPEALAEEEPELSFVLSVTQGKFWHQFVQHLLLDNGILVQDEVPLCDPVHRRRGHTDGQLANGELFEFKTANSRSFRKLTNLEALRECTSGYIAGYYGQTQDYLDMAEVEHMRYLVMCMEPPYEFAEFVVPADPMFQAKQRMKYREAIETAAEVMAEREAVALSSEPTPEPSPVLLYGTPLH